MAFVMEEGGANEDFLPIILVSFQFPIMWCRAPWRAGI